MTPEEASKKENECKLQDLYLKNFKKYEAALNYPSEGKSGSYLRGSAYSQFKVGECVKISVYMSLFTKGYKHNWSKEIFIVSIIHLTKTVTYSIKDFSDEEITGKFYSQELLH